MIRGVGPYSALITPQAGSLFHAVFHKLYHDHCRWLFQSFLICRALLAGLPWPCSSHCVVAPAQELSGKPAPNDYHRSARGEERRECPAPPPLQQQQAL